MIKVRWRRYLVIIFVDESNTTGVVSDRVTLSLYLCVRCGERASDSLSLSLSPSLSVRCGERARASGCRWSSAVSSLVTCVTQLCRTASRTSWSVWPTSLWPTSSVSWAAWVSPDLHKHAPLSDVVLWHICNAIQYCICSLYSGHLDKTHLSRSHFNPKLKGISLLISLFIYYYYIFFYNHLFIIYNFIIYLSLHIEVVLVF